MINLGDLGRPTRRGIKKCPKCGTENGCRGVICKNKNCDAVFKDSAEKRRISLTAVRLAGILRHIYSVTVRDNTNERGFVQLPYFSANTEEDINKTLSKDALCFVDSCQRIFDDSILKYHETEINNSLGLCSHIESAINSTDTAIPIEFKQKTLESLNVADDIKEKLWILDLEQEGPLVQRVSKTVMAVKCQVSSEHPLGYLHCTFRSSKGVEAFDEFSCSCTDFKSKQIFLISERRNHKLKCIHYYACIGALTNDPRYSEQFSRFIHQDSLRSKTSDKIIRAASVTNSFLSSNDNVINIAPFKGKLVNKKSITEGKLLSPKTTVNSCKKSNVIKVRKNISRTNLGNKKLLRNTSQETQKRLRKLAPNPILQIKVLEETDIPPPILEPFWTFFEWLSYVTESINQTMLFKNIGTVNNLVFGIPESFYNEFVRRIPTCYHSENQNDFIIYSIMNIRHVKEIFDTPKIKLRISKKIVHVNGNYVEIDENDDQSHDSSFIFFLNVGASTVDENNDTNNAFIIEWLPNITQFTKIGQLKLSYKYGYKST